MSEQEKEIAKTLAEAFNALPDDKKEYLIGFAEGVVTMAERQAANGEGLDSARAG